MKNDKLDILVISDLHAHSGDPNLSASPSFLSTNSLYADLNPIAKIPDLLRSEDLFVDWIVTPGDLGDKADPSAQKFAWEELNRLKLSLEATHLIATAGNHDLDSRRAFPEFDLKGALQSLSPSFPIEMNCFMPNDGVFGDRYWSRNFVVIPFPDFDCTVLIINSCAFHGYASASDGRPPDEHTRGKLSALTREAVFEAIKRDKTRLNILLVHHHPVKLPYIEDGNSIMIGGGELIDTLKMTKRQWLILHGHQHVPYLTYADSDPFAPVVLSAGSVSARTFPLKGTHPRNQVHHISIPLSEMEAGGVDLFGRVTSWSWINTGGWQRAQLDAGIPYHSGFGYRFDAKQTRDEIVTMAKSTNLLDWRTVSQQIPKLDFVVPNHLQSLLSMIEDKGVAIERGQFGIPLRLEFKQ
jgi:3',5'-cyclic AMP phosphodiesterase CpdA